MVSVTNLYAKARLDLSALIGSANEQNRCEEMWMLVTRGEIYCCIWISE